MSGLCHGRGDRANAYGHACDAWPLCETTARETAPCSCARHDDGSVTTMLCPAHADRDPCATMAAVTGKRRTGSVVRGRCTACGWGAHQHYGRGNRA